MHQAASIPAPPPTPQSPRVSGNAIGEAVREAIAGSLAPVRAELQAELAKAVAERAVIQAQLNASPSGAARASLERRLDEVNQRIDKLESGVNALDRQLPTTDGPRFGGTLVPPPARAAQTPFGPNFDPAPMVVMIVSIIFIGFPLSIAFARLLWRRATHAAPSPQVAAETTRRFDRLEQSVDAIAIEVERISENQRYLTKLLAEPGKREVISGS
jgi:hypothetical protein